MGLNRQPHPAIFKSLIAKKNQEGTLGKGNSNLHGP